MPKSLAAETRPYDSPVVSDFRSKAFQRSTARWQLLVASFNHNPGAMWIHPNEGNVRSKSYGGKAKWRWKIYLCVSARDYWPCIARLCQAFRRSSLHWKFFAHREGYDRPDKIVFYARSVRHLRALIPRIRSVVRGCSFHDLSHAAPSSGLGLERKSLRGLFVGCDPLFLDPSWRLYRCFVHAWAAQNVAYLHALPEGRARWFERMNLSEEHEGPANLNPKSPDVAYVRRYWRIIMSRD